MTKVTVLCCCFGIVFVLWLLPHLVELVAWILLVLVAFVSTLFHACCVCVLAESLRVFITVSVQWVKSIIHVWTARLDGVAQTVSEACQTK